MKTIRPCDDLLCCLALAASCAAIVAGLDEEEALHARAEAIATALGSRVRR